MFTNAILLTNDYYIVQIYFNRSFCSKVLKVLQTSFNRRELSSTLIHCVSQFNRSKVFCFTLVIFICIFHIRFRKLEQKSTRGYWPVLCHKQY